MFKTFRFLSSLPYEECVARLSQSAERDGIARHLRSHDPGTVFCSISGHSVRLFASGTRFVSNPFEPRFDGVLQGTDSGTILQGRFTVSPLVVLFTCIWFGGLVLFGGLAALIGLAQYVAGDELPPAEASPLLMFGTLIAMLGIGATLVAFGWKMGRPQRVRVQKFIEETMSARRLTNR